MITVEAYNRLLLDLYRASREFTMKAFQSQALELIRPHIPFDSVWWAMATEIEAGRHHIHDSYLYDLPDDCAEIGNLNVQSNIIARTCTHSPGICFNFTSEQLSGNLPTALFTQYCGVQHLICTSWRGRISQLSIFLGLSRRDGRFPFSEDERRLKECLMPHLADMMQSNRVMHIASIRAGNSGHASAMAVVDELGMLHAAEPGFEAHLRNEWPVWDGPFLPKPLKEAQATKTARYLGNRVVVRIERVGDSTLVTAARRAPGDALSARERDVAEVFASGESYKEVARRLGMAPATVRHHLRSTYEKLGISDKGELARLLNQGDTQTGKE